MTKEQLTVWTDGRGVSAVLGAVLLLGVVVMSVTLMASFGANVTDERTGELTAATAETNLQRLGDTVRAVSSGANPRLEVSFEEFSGAEDEIGVISGGSVQVEVGGTTYVDTQIDAVGVRVDEAVIAYQSGGVWRVPEGQPAAAEIVSGPPATVVRGDNATSITFPVYRVQSDGGVASRVEVVAVNSTRIYDPLLVPASDPVRITVQSRFAAAWKQYFAQTFPERDRQITYNEQTDTVVLTYEGGRAYNLYLHGFIHVIKLDQ